MAVGGLLRASRGIALAAVAAALTGLLAVGCGSGGDGADRGSADGGRQGDAGGSAPLDALDDLRAYVNLGDSVGAGYNAGGQNAEGGHGYARLLYENHPDYPAYAEHNVKALLPGAELADRAKGGATSTDVVGQSVLIPQTDGDVLVTIYVGGNDFKAELSTLTDPSETQIAIDRWIENTTAVVDRLRDAYDHADRGQRLVIVVSTIHEPTDGMITIPPEYDQKFCGLLQTLLKLGEDAKKQVWSNLVHFNESIRAFADERGLLLLDSQNLVVGHGLNAPPKDQWIDDDCTHFNDRGHHELRREVWRLLTGEVY